MNSDQLDSLDEIARLVAIDDFSRYDALDTADRLYVALAANRPDLVQADGYTIALALQRLGEARAGKLVSRWYFKPDPRPAERHAPMPKHPREVLMSFSGGPIMWSRGRHPSSGE